MPREGSAIANTGYGEVWLQACHLDSLNSSRQVQCLAIFLYVRNSEERSGFFFFLVGGVVGVGQVEERVSWSFGESPGKPLPV